MVENKSTGGEESRGAGVQETERGGHVDSQYTKRQIQKVDEREREEGLQPQE